MARSRADHFIRWHLVESAVQQLGKQQKLAAVWHAVSQALGGNPPAADTLPNNLTRGYRNKHRIVDLESGSAKHWRALAHVVDVVLRGETDTKRVVAQAIRSADGGNEGPVERLFLSYQRAMDLDAAEAKSRGRDTAEWSDGRYAMLAIRFHLVDRNGIDEVFHTFFGAIAQHAGFRRLKVERELLIYGRPWSNHETQDRDGGFALSLTILAMGAWNSMAPFHLFAKGAGHTSSVFTVIAHVGDVTDISSEAKGPDADRLATIEIEQPSLVITDSLLRELPRSVSDWFRPLSDDLYVYATAELEEQIGSQSRRLQTLRYQACTRLEQTGDQDSDLWYITVATREFRRCSVALREAMEQVVADHPDISDASVWSLHGSREILVRYRAPSPVAQAAFGFIRERITMLAEWDPVGGRARVDQMDVREEYPYTGELNEMFKRGRLLLTGEAPWLESPRAGKAFILFRRPDGFGKGWLGDLQERLLLVHEIVASYAVSRNEQLVMVEFFLPHGALEGLHLLSQGLERLVRADMSKHTYHAYNAEFLTPPDSQPGSALSSNWRP